MPSPLHVSLSHRWKRSQGVDVSPRTILGPLLHADFDAADPGIVLNVGKVASIPNRGGDSAAMVQATATAQPAFGAASFAGGPGITFDAIDDTMSCVFATPIPSGRRPYVWAVFKANSLTASDQVVAVLEGTPAVRYFVVWCNRAGTAVYSAGTSPAGGAGSISAFGVPTEIVNTHLLEVGETINGIGAFVLDGLITNGTPSGAFVPTDAVLTTLRLAAYQGTTQFGGCTIRRIIVANDLPSQAQIDAMRDYLTSQPYGIPKQRPPLPASAVEYWHSELECTPASWVGQIGGRSLAGVNGTRIVAADPGFFNGRVVGQTNSATGAAWRGTGLVGLPGAGTRPWLYLVARLRDTSTGSAEIMFGVGRNTVDDDGRFLAAGGSFIAARTGAFNVNGSATDTALHRFKAWLDGVNANFHVDNVAFSNADTYLLAANTNAAAIGLGSGGGNFPSDANVAFALIASSRPTPAEEYYLDEWAWKYFGAPRPGPSSILGPLLHADFDVADPGVTMGVGTVASIPNRGNDTAAMVQATAANQPTYNATSFAGGPGMSFDGVNDLMLCTFASAIPSGRRPYMWIVFRADSSSVVDRVDASLYGSTPTLTYIAARHSTSGTAAFTGQILSGGAGALVGFGATETVNTHLMEVGPTVGGTKGAVLDNVPANFPSADSNPIPSAITALSLGTYGGSPAYCSACTIRRVIVANDMPTSAQIQAVRDYLRAQPYGLTF